MTKNSCIKSRKVYSGHWWYNKRTVTVKWCKKYQHQQMYIILVKCGRHGAKESACIALETEEEELAEQNRLLEKLNAKM